MKRKVIFNHPELKNRRRKLRSDSTEAEKIIWNKLRNSKLGSKFFRQYSVEGYVIDFYCPEKRLAIELDGEYHNKPDAKIYDRYREKAIMAYNIRVLRFKNEEIIDNKKSVLEKICVSLLN